MSRFLKNSRKYSLFVVDILLPYQSHVIVNKGIWTGASLAASSISRYLKHGDMDWGHLAARFTKLEA